MEDLAARSALLDYFVRGGPWMWALLICSVVAVAVIIYKIVALWLAGKGADRVVDDVTARVEAGDIDAATQQAEESSTSVGRVLATVLAAHEGPQSPREAAEASGAEELAHLESGLMTLATIANIAPLIGFLGTVSGMIRAFTAIAEAGLGEPGVVAAGIGEALITTASGLIVAIPCFVAYNALVARVNALALGIELAGTRIANLVRRRNDDAA
ncbi:MAG: MotA/TolQ/ExbB proton channel family protein [Armatimonadia bacterium]|nr:MotA/TolQ/ExbB proton channel family protein [Armatimonadia bacterium]